MSRPPRGISKVVQRYAGWILHRFSGVAQINVVPTKLRRCTSGGGCTRNLGFRGFLRQIFLGGHSKDETTLFLFYNKGRLEHSVLSLLIVQNMKNSSRIPKNKLDDCAAVGGAVNAES